MNHEINRAGNDPAPEFPPNAMVITGPVGSGKTELAIDAILDARLLSPFGAIWVLLASGQQIHAFRRRLVTRSTNSVQFGVEFFDFASLYRRILDLYGESQRMIDETTRYQVVRQVIGDLLAQEALPLFAPVAERAGFVGLVAGLIYELKQGLVSPDHFLAVAQDRGEKDREVARIYAAYQAFLQQRRLVDRHGAGWLAIEHLGHAPLPATVKLLVVDGFDQFHDVHAHVLASLARKVKSSLLTLTAVPGRAGRRFQRFEQTLARIVEAGRAASNRRLWEVRALNPADVPEGATRHPVLEHLASALFQGRAEAVPAGDALALIEAPDAGREVGAVLRRIKRLLLAGVSAESILVVVRDMGRYSAALREAASVYGLPLVVREGIPLRENPVVALLLGVLDLAEHDFPRRELLDVLRSPYLKPHGLDAADCAWLERFSQERQIVRGRDVWLEELRAADRVRVDEDGEPVDDALASDASRIAAALEAFFERVTPPDGGTAYEFVAWIEQWIGTDPASDVLDRAEQATETGDGEAPTPPAEPDRHDLDVIGSVRATTDAGRVSRDILALQAFKRLLSGIRAAYDLLAGRGPLPVLSWEQFRAELRLAVDRERLVPPGGLNRIGRVLATDAAEARGLPHDHVFVMGLSEGVFPAQQPDRGLYQDGERRSLEAAGIPMLTAAERADDLSLFYQVTGLARRTLTLSRFSVTDKGTPCPPSPFWRAVRAVIEVPEASIERMPVGAVPRLDEAATLSEVANAVAAQFSGEHASDEAITALGAYNALLAAPSWSGRWRSVLHNRALEARREDPASPFDSFMGVLADPSLVAEVARRCGPGRVWSTSQLDEFGACPFRFFARRMLHLKEVAEPEEGLDRLQLGSVVHAILEETYHAISARHLVIHPDNREHALDILYTAAEDVFAGAPQAYGFRASQVWEYEQEGMLRRLASLVAKDFEGGGPFADQVAGEERVTLAVEKRFGFGTQAALIVDGPAGPLRVRGVIDRIDRVGDQIIVIDYKTGSTKRKIDDIAAGREFQMAIYLLAAEQLLSDADLTVFGGAYWHIRSGQTSGEVLAGDEVIEYAVQHMHHHVLRAREGCFPVIPSVPYGPMCKRFCEFRRLCRVSPAVFRKTPPDCDDVFDE